MKFRVTSESPSIARRLAGFSVVFVTASVIVASTILYLIVVAVVREQIDQRLDTQLESLRHALTVTPNGEVTVSGSLDGPPFDRRGSGWYWQVSGNGVHLTSQSLAGADIRNPPRPFDWSKSLTSEPRPGDEASLHGEKLHLRVIEALIGNKTLEMVATAPETALSEP